MKKITILITIFLTLLLFSPSYAAEKKPSSLVLYPKILFNDTKIILTAPLRFEKKEWLTTPIIGLTVIATGFLLDKPVSDSFKDKNQSSLQVLDPFGSYYAIAILGGYFLAGTIFDNTKANQIAEDGIAASLIASGIIVPATKWVVGRSRPSANYGADHFNPFHDDDGSFPSAHTTQAFALASVIAAHYDSLWIKTSVYTLASLVGYSRIEQNKHFVSDVVAGGIIGTVVGNAVVNYNQQQRFLIIPSIKHNSMQVTLTTTF